MENLDKTSNAFWKHDVTNPLKVTYKKLLYSFQLSTKVITQTNQNSHKQFIEPIRTPSQYSDRRQAREKRAVASYD